MRRKILNFSWHKIKSHFFNERFPIDVQVGEEDDKDLRTCFRMFAKSSHYDATYGLDEDCVVNVWKRLCKEGTGHLIITESRAFAPFLDNEPIVGVYFSAYITQQYAKEVAAPTTDMRKICMDFLRKYHNFFTEPSRGYDPAHTKKSIETGYGKPDFRMYYINFFLILNPKLPPQSTIPDRFVSTFSSSKQDALKKVFGGFQFHGWFNVVCGETAKDAFIGLGHRLLRKHPDNPNVDNDAKYYLFCATLSQEASRELKIPEETTCHCSPTEWLRCHISNGSLPTLALSPLQKTVAYLLVLDYDPKQITSYVFDIGYAHADFEDRHSDIRQEIFKIRNALRGKNVTSLRRKLVDAILANMHEIRPLIVPLYPDPSVERPLRVLNQKRS